MTTMPLRPEPAGPVAQAGFSLSPQEKRARDVTRLPNGPFPLDGTSAAALTTPIARVLLASATARAGLSVGDVRSGPTPPRVLDGAAIEPRFRYWYGRSGRRYLFSEVDRTAMADLDDAVILVAGRDGERPLHVGSTVSADLPAGRLYVHLLAKSAADRAEVVADLTPPRDA